MTNPSAEPRIDIHQHLWPETFLTALSQRRSAPSIRRDGADWILRTDREPEYRFRLSDHDPAARAAELDVRGTDRALIALSSPLGVEALPFWEAEPLLEAYHEGLRGLDPRLGAWGAIGVRNPDAGTVDALLDEGFVGISVPAGAVASRAGLERLGPSLERLEGRNQPLFVHPGPGSAAAAPSGSSEDPHWWAAMTSYVSQMSAAWHAFAEWGRPSHPSLRVVFAMLAGGAPLHLERLTARGGPVSAVFDPLSFYDTSSYGERAIDAMVRTVGIDQLVYGSDRPVVAGASPAVLGPAAAESMLVRNPARLLGTEAATEAGPA